MIFCVIASEEELKFYREKVIQGSLEPIERTTINALTTHTDTWFFYTPYVGLDNRMCGQSFDRIYVKKDCITKEILNQMKHRLFPPTTKETVWL